MRGIDGRQYCQSHVSGGPNMVQWEMLRIQRLAAMFCRQNGVPDVSYTREVVHKAWRWAQQEAEEAVARRPQGSVAWDLGVWRPRMRQALGLQRGEWLRCCDPGESAQTATSAPVTETALLWPIFRRG